MPIYLEQAKQDTLLEENLFDPLERRSGRKQSCGPSIRPSFIAHRFRPSFTHRHELPSVVASVGTVLFFLVLCTVQVRIPEHTALASAMRCVGRSGQQMWRARTGRWYYGFPIHCPKVRTEPPTTLPGWTFSPKDAKGVKTGRWQ